VRKAIVTVAACAALLWVGTAQALSDEHKCLIERAKAKGRYEQCMEKALFKGYTGGAFGSNAKVAKCRRRYTSTWTKLQTLTASPTCTVPRFVDNGATLTDNLTGLVWEKKTTEVGSGTDFGQDVGDVDNRYGWTSADGDQTDEDGTAFTDFLTTLNAGSGFGSANGWRLPTFKELHTILLPETFPCTTHPCIYPIFGPTQSDWYLSATTNSGSPHNAWVVNFFDGYVYPGQKIGTAYVRAVRGGL